MGANVQPNAAMPIGYRRYRLPTPTAAMAARLPGLAVASLYILILGSLFAGLPGPAALGELRGEGALPGVLAIMLFAALSGVIADVRGGRAALVFLPLVISILLSYAVNADDIGRAHFMGRDGGQKFINSLMVLGFYASAFYAAFCLVSVYGVELVLRYAGRAAVVATVVLAVAFCIEILTWFSPPLRDAWLSVRALWTYSRYAPLYRLVGFASEPSFTSISALGLLGFLGTGIVLAGWPKARAALEWRTPLVLAAGLFVLELLANARTFLAGAAGIGLAALLIIGPLRRLPPLATSAAIVFTPLAVQAAMIWSVLQSSPAAQSVSNITRSVGMLTATELWSRHPLLGVGLGQYAFHFRSVVPSWGLQSWEVSRYFRPDQYDLIAGLPPSFSLFTRLGAELGLLGFVAWSLPALYAIRRALILSPGRLTNVMICALAAQIWTGLSLDSFRNVFYWLWLACLLAWPDQFRAPTGEPLSPAKETRRLSLNGRLQ